VKKESLSTRARNSSSIQPLFEFSSLVNSSLDLKFVLDSVLLTLMGKLMISKGMVLLKTDERQFRVESYKGLPARYAGYELLFPKISKKSFSLSTTTTPFLAEYIEQGIVRMFPIVSHNAVVGFVGIGRTRSAKNFSAEDKKFIEAIVNISVAAIEKALSFKEIKSVNRELDGKIQELGTLFELSKEFNAILDRDKLLKLLTFTLMGQIGASKYAICLKDGAALASRVELSAIAPIKSLMFEIVSSPLRVADLGRRKNLLSLRDTCEKQGIVALIPLQSQNEIKGVLCLGNKLREGDYTDSDLEFIYSLGNLAIVSLENTRLFYEAVEKKKLENELAIAREIQKGLLPAHLPQLDGFEIAAVNVSSNQVGGDYYDVITLGNGRYIVAIGDVSGKGTPASLLMANVQATIRTLVQFDLPLSEMTARVNQLIYESTGMDKFITFFWGILDLASKRFRYVNAGHNHPFLLRGEGAIERLTEGGIILGVMKSVPPYEEGEVQLSSGDTIVMFTDGVSEAMSKEGVDYTEERLEAFLRTIAPRSANEILEEVRSEITRYATGAPQSDDITLLVLKCT
jgi:phosphoserine phosphatase RsbU/P